MYISKYDISKPNIKKFIFEPVLPETGYMRGTITLWLFKDERRFTTPKWEYVYEYNIINSAGISENVSIDGCRSLKIKLVKLTGCFLSFLNHKELIAINATMRRSRALFNASVAPEYEDVIPCEYNFDSIFAEWQYGQGATLSQHPVYKADKGNIHAVGLGAAHRYIYLGNCKNAGWYSSAGYMEDVTVISKLLYYKRPYFTFNDSELKYLSKVIGDQE